MKYIQPKNKLDELAMEHDKQHAEVEIQGIDYDEYNDKDNFFYIN